MRSGLKLWRSRACFYHKLRLPETLGKPLPQTIEEAEENYNRKRYSDEKEMDDLEKDSVFENFEDGTDWK